MVLYGFAGYHIWLIKRNTTTNESYKWTDYVRYINFYRQKEALQKATLEEKKEKEKELSSATNSNNNNTTTTNNNNNSTNTKNSNSNSNPQKETDDELKARRRRRYRITPSSPLLFGREGENQSEEYLQQGIPIQHVGSPQSTLLSFLSEGKASPSYSFFYSFYFFFYFICKTKRTTKTEIIRIQIHSNNEIKYLLQLTNYSVIPVLYFILCYIITNITWPFVIVAGMNTGNCIQMVVEDNRKYKWLFRICVDRLLLLLLSSRSSMMWIEI